MIIFAGPIGQGTLYVALYRAADGYFRSTGTTFADPAGLDVTDFRAGLYTATEVTFDTGGTPKGTGFYLLNTGNIAIGDYVADKFDDNAIDPDNQDNKWTPGFEFTADGAGGQLGPLSAEKIADVLIRRTIQHIEASSDGDTLSKDSLYGLMRQIQDSSVSGTALIIKKSDGNTLGTRTIASSAGADPVTGIS